MGQNVNSYHDNKSKEALSLSSTTNASYRSAKGFTNLYKKRDGPGLRFADLLAMVSEIDPEMRIRLVVVVVVVVAAAVE